MSNDFMEVVFMSLKKLLLNQNHFTKREVSPLMDAKVSM